MWLGSGAGVWLTGVRSVVEVLVECVAEVHLGCSLSVVGDVVEVHFGCSRVVRSWSVVDRRP